MASASGLHLRFLGGFAIERAGTPLPVPTSRKARALLAWLVINARPQRRERLCELLFDRTDDPRGALRWNLARLRPLLNSAAAEHLLADRETAAFQRLGAAVDVDDLRALTRPEALAAATTEALEAAAASLCGPFLAGSEPELAPEFGAWLAAVREDCRVQQRRLLETLIARLHAEPARRLAAAQRLVQLDPLDEEAHAACVAALMALDRPDEARRLAEAATASFRRERIGLSGTLAAALAARPGVPVARDQRIIATLAVLPFRALGAEAEARQWLAEGLIDGVADALSRYAMLRVLAPGATGPADTAGFDPIATAAALGADYLLGGSVQIAPAPAGERLRIRYRLIVGRSAAIAWSGTLERPLADFLALQDAVAAEIANAIEPRIASLRLESGADRPEVDLAAHDHHLRGLSAGFGSGRRDYGAAADAFARALAIAPDFAPALAYLPWAQGMAMRLATPADFAAAIAMARRAIALAGSDARTLAMGAMSLVFLGQDYEAGLPAVDRALRLNPNDPVVLISAAWIRATAGEHDGPMALFDRAARLNPLPDAENGNIQAGRAICCLVAGQYPEALRWADAALALAPLHPSALFSATAAAAALGDPDAAQRRAAAFTRLIPQGLASPIVRGLPFRRKDDQAQIFALLRAAGVPG